MSRKAMYVLAFGLAWLASVYFFGLRDLARAGHSNNLKQLALACHNYHSYYSDHEFSLRDEAHAQEDADWLQVELVVEFFFQDDGFEELYYGLDRDLQSRVDEEIEFRMLEGAWEPEELDWLLVDLGAAMFYQDELLFDELFYRTHPFTQYRILEEIQYSRP